MLNTIWPWFILISIGYSFFSGNIDKINTGIYESTKNAIDLCIILFGNVALWSGLMKIISKTKIIKILCRIMSPIVMYLFPETRDNKELKELISMNIISNLLGLGNAATPIGIKAINCLHEENNRNKNMSNSMMMLILINSASIQLIPTTILAIRQSLGAKNPNSIIVQVWIATISAAAIGIVTFKILFRKKH